ncbi:MAG: RNA-binding S4 domain-containing protein [Acutalibacteraceae bacterium]
MSVEKIYIDQEYIKLDSLLKFGGIAETGGQAKLLVQDGLVLLNGEVCTQRGRKIKDGDKVQFEEKILEVLRK